jgi:hypothetical protein
MENQLDATITVLYTQCQATRSENLPTISKGHYTICCKISQSCAPEDGQKLARNMLS